MLGRARDGHRSRRTGPAAGIVLVLALGLAGCGDGDGDAALRAAEVNVTAKQEALDSAEEAAAEATSALCAGLITDTHPARAYVGWGTTSSAAANAWALWAACHRCSSLMSRK